MSQVNKNFAEQQHFIPQFVLKNFRAENNKIIFTDIKQTPLKVLKGSPRKLMREKDFYEIRENNGNYVFRNAIEDIYSSFEGDIKPDFQKFIDLSKQEDFEGKFVEIIQNEQWATIETNLLLYLIITLIRGKKIKYLVHSNSNLSNSEKQIMYLLFTTSQVYTVQYAKKMYIGQELEDILLFIKDSPEEPLKILFEHIMNNYQIRVHKSFGNKMFFLSDNPIIIQKFEGEDYHMPISSEICIGLIPIKKRGENILVEHTIYKMSDENIDRINEQLVLNTDRMLIISKEDDLDFVSSIISKEENVISRDG